MVPSWLNIETRTAPNYVSFGSSSGHSAADLQTSNRDEWPCFRSMLDCATVFGGRDESSGKSRLISRRHESAS